jgi:prophage regulatory protein
MGMTNNGASPGGPEPPGELLWNIKTVIQKTGLSRATIYRYTQRNLFPQKRRIGPNRVGWLAAEVIAWASTLPRRGE